MEGVVDVAPGYDENDRALRSIRELRQRGEGSTVGGAFDPQTRRRDSLGSPPGHGALGDEDMRRATSPNTSTASGIATRTASPSANVADLALVTTTPASPAFGHDRGLLRRHAERTSRGPRREAQADAAEQRAVSDGNDDRRRRIVQLVEELVGDRAVPLVLGAFCTVLEEGSLAPSACLRASSFASSRSAPKSRVSAPNASIMASFARVAPAGA